MIKKISATQNSKKIVKLRKLKNLEVFDAGLGENLIKQPEFLIESIKKYAYKKNYTSTSGINILQKTLSEYFSNKTYIVDKILLGNGLKELIYS